MKGRGDPNPRLGAGTLPFVSVNTVGGSTTKPVSSRSLLDILGAMEDLEGEVTTGFPLIEGDGVGRAVDALLAIPSRGLVVFDLVEGSSLGDFEERQDDLVRMITGRLMNHRDLMVRRKLIPTITAVTFAPGVQASETMRITSDDYPVATSETLPSVISSIPVDISQVAIYDNLIAAVQNTAGLKKRSAPRVIASPESRGAKLQALEDSIATLDQLQSRAVIEPISGVQRIRGLAGSGKTVVLALKAAYLHRLHPEWRIAVTFNTRSLKDQFRRLIRTFYASATGNEPDWNQLRILNAWGGAGADPERGGIYSEFCELSDVQFLNYGQARSRYSSSGAFAGACRAAIEESEAVREAYDLILVDEAQDLPAAFLQMCYMMLRHPKRLVYAYDELQDLVGEGVASAEEIFGKGADGRPVVDFESNDGFRRDVVLEKCYRNSRPLLVTAHALGFGIYRQPPAGREIGLVQLFEHAQLWEEIGYTVERGPLEAERDVILNRTPDASPSFLEAHSSIEDLIIFKRFDTAEEQNEWVANEVSRNITEDELRHDDIVVINPNGITARENLSPVRALLLERGVANHLAGVDTSADVFFNRETESVTFTGIHRAKGNEAGMVYIVNAEEGMDARFNLSSIRNRIFTAITRSKAWVRVLGVGEAMDRLVAEFEQVKRSGFKLHFRYPTAEERSTLTLLHRDVSPEAAAAIQTRTQALEAFLADLDQQKMFAEDLDPDLREAIIRRLGGQ